MDPRVKTSTAGLEKKFHAEMQLAAITTETTQALHQGGSIQSQIEKLTPTAQTKEAIAEFQTKLSKLLGAQGGFGAPPSQEVTLSRVNGAAGTLYQQVWQADAEPTSVQLELVSSTERDSAEALKRWNDFKSTDLPALNRLLHDSKSNEINAQAEVDQPEAEIDEE
jgi:hypothetical protein